MAVLASDIMTGGEDNMAQGKNHGFFADFAVLLRNRFFSVSGFASYVNVVS